jgi:hypothetical protein
MDEKKERTAEDSGNGNKPQSNTLIEAANQAAERLERANQERALLLAREEELEARRRLGGMTEMSTPVQPKVETPREYRDRILKGQI